MLGDVGQNVITVYRMNDLTNLDGHLYIGASVGIPLIRIAF